MIRNAGSLVGTFGATSLLGVAYWAVAARTFTTTAVGFASAAVAAMTLVATLSSLGLGTMLMGEIPNRLSEGRRLTYVTLLLAAAAAAVLGLVVCVLSPVLSAELSPLRANALNVLIFAVGCVVTAVGLVADEALIGFMRGGLQLARNVVFGVSKLLLLLAIAFATATQAGMTLFTTWVVGGLLSLLATFGAGPLRLSRADPAVRGQPLVSAARWVLRNAAGHQAINVGLKVPQLLLPILVVALLSVEANAVFYISWMITSFIGVVPGSMSNVLYATGASDLQALSAKLKFSLRVSALLVAALVLFILAFSPLLLSIFGEAYADTGTAALRLLALSSLPLIIKTHYVAVMRIRRRLKPASRLIWAAAAVEILSSCLGAVLGGLPGLTLGWLVAMTLESLVMGPQLLKVVRDARGRGGPLQPSVGVTA